jgi:hypothetical protein
LRAAHPAIDRRLPRDYPTITRRSPPGSTRTARGAYDDEPARFGRFPDEGGSVARAKHTGRAEARRRYRQATIQPTEDAAEALEGESRPATGAMKQQARPGARPAPAPSGRPGFMTAIRGAYHPAHIREDLAKLPQLLTSRALLAGIAITLAAAVAYWLLPNYDGSTMGFQLIVVPGAALLPQLVAGFFAPSASYLLGLIVGVVQGIAFLFVVTSLATRTGTPITPEAMNSVLLQSLVTGPLSSSLFAAAAAWYRRFLALSSPRRAQPGRAGAARSTKPNAARRPAGR